MSVVTSLYCPENVLRIIKAAVPCWRSEPVLLWVALCCFQTSSSKVKIFGRENITVPLLPMKDNFPNLLDVVLVKYF